MSVRVRGRWLALGGAMACIACASIAPPPGAPEMKTPPSLLAVTPDSGEVGVAPQSVVFRFSESINDRPPKGELDQYFIISPMAGAPRVTWNHERLLVRPTRGFRANTAYTITMLPGLSNFRGGTMATGKSVLFATGAQMPSLGILGRVFDWQAGRPLVSAVVLAISHPDSTVYIALTDSLGGFTIGPFGAGNYTVLAFADANHNYSLDRGEPFDSTDIAVSTTRPLIELDAIVRDTIAPRMTTVTASDSVTLTVQFDRALDPQHPPVLTDVLVQRADSTSLTVTRVRTDAALERERADSVAHADSVRAASDTTNKDRSTGTGHAIAATVPKPRLPAPPLSLEVKLSPATPLVPKNAYKITVRNATGITGRQATSARVIAIAAPDTTHKKLPVPNDSTHKLPGQPPDDTTHALPGRPTDAVPPTPAKPPR